MEAYALFEHLHLEMIGWPTADRDEHITVLEGIGYKVGLALCQRLCKDKPRFKEELDIIKFICQDFWVSTFEFFYGGEMKKNLESVFQKRSQLLEDR